jgi:hypothetical protein
MTKAENRAAAKAWHAEREAERVRTGPLGISPGQSHIVEMKKSPRVVFQPKRITETVWQLRPVSRVPKSESLAVLPARLMLMTGWPDRERWLG